MTPEEREKNEQGLLVLNELCKSVFYYPTIESIETIRKLIVFGTEEEFQDYLLARTDRILCAYCTSAAEFYECMKTDQFYKRPICTQCRNKDIKRRYDRLAKRGKADPGKYLITAEAARAKAKGFLVLDPTGSNADTNTTP